MTDFISSAGNKATIIQKIKEGYLLWLNVCPHIPKSARYAIGARIENKMIDLLELAYDAYFSRKECKLEKVCKCVFILNALKFLVSIAWEAKIISNRQFEDLSLKLDETGRMLNGWKNSLLAPPEKKNRDL
ncbi:MAG: four helix bundle protein [Parcubacteria group bacterium]